MPSSVLLPISTPSLPSPSNRSRTPSTIPWNEPRRWSDRGFRQSRRILSNNISRRSWMSESVSGGDPFGSSLSGFYQFTITLDLESSKFSSGGVVSTDSVLRSFANRAGKSLCGVVVFDVGRNGNPHLHGFVAVKDRSGYLEMEKLWSDCSSTFGSELDWGKLNTSTDVGKWVRYILKSRDWHGDLPPCIEERFGRYRGMATLFGNPKKVDKVEMKVEIKDDGDVEVTIPKEVESLEGNKYRIFSVPVEKSQDENDIKACLGYYSGKGLDMMLSAGVHILAQASIPDIQKKMGLDRICDPLAITMMEALYESDSYAAAAMLYSHMLEVKPNRAFLAVDSVLEAGGTAELMVDGHIVPPEMDNMFGVTFRPLENGESKI